MSLLKNLFGSGSRPDNTNSRVEDRADNRPDQHQGQSGGASRTSGQKAGSQEKGKRQSQQKNKGGARDKGQKSKDNRSRSNPKGRKQTPPKPKPPNPETIGFFGELDLPGELTSAIADLGFTDATPVQHDVLPHSLAGEDVIAQAQTGTGKTAAFLISILTYHLENPEESARSKGTPFALVIAPTRELVLQITADAESLSEYIDINVLSVVGGIDYDLQRQQLQKQVDIVVATPGRLLDFCRSRTIDLGSVDSLVIDEADRMLSMGFIPDVKAIIRRTPYKDVRQTQLFSATFSEDIKRLAESWTREPVRIEIEPKQVAVETVDQRFYLTASDAKFDVLYNLFNEESVSRVIVFVNRRDQTRRLFERMRKHNIRCGMLTGEVPQRKRIKTLDDFKEGRIQVLVATDVAGRGIHVDDISHVVNYNLPEDPEDYVHRIGRTGRAGSAGTAISLVCEDDSFMMPDIEALLGTSVNYEQPAQHLLNPAPQAAGQTSRSRH